MSIPDREIFKFWLGIVLVGFGIWMFPLPASTPITQGFADLQISVDITKSSLNNTGCDPERQLPALANVSILRTDHDLIQIEWTFFGLGYSGKWLKLEAKTRERISALDCLNFQFGISSSTESIEVDLYNIDWLRLQPPGDHLIQYDPMYLRKPFSGLPITFDVVAWYDYSFKLIDPPSLNFLPKGFDLRIQCRTCFRGTYKDYGYDLQLSVDFLGEQIKPEDIYVDAWVSDDSPYDGKVVKRETTSSGGLLAEVDLSDSRREYLFTRNMAISGLLIPLGIGFLISFLRFWMNRNTEE